jgi:hypothetical protein
VQAEERDLTSTKFAELYQLLAGLGGPLPETINPDPNRKCAAAGERSEAAVEVSGNPSDDRVLSVSVCDGKLELNSDQCSVNPCELAQYITVLQSRLAALADI